VRFAATPAKQRKPAATQKGQNTMKSTASRVASLSGTIALAAILAAGCGRSVLPDPGASAAAGVTPAPRDTVASLHATLSGTVREVLPNGLTVLVLEDHSAPVVSVQVWIGTGSQHEQEYLGSGISHAIEHMIFKGTERRGIGAITREINDAGGKINAYTTLDRTVFHTDLPSRHLKVGLDVLSDAVFNAAFPEEEWKKEREVIMREIAMGEDDPGRVLGKLSWATALTVHPSRVPTIGYPDAFSNLTREDLVRFARRNYLPDNMIVAVAGDLSAAAAITEVKASFGAAQRRARAPVVLPQEPPQAAPRFARRTGIYNVSRLAWIYPAVPLQHPDAAALDVLAAITGHGRSSRLTSRIREQKQIVHSIGAWSYTPKDIGLFGISASFAPQREAEVTNAIAAEITSWLNDGFTAAEVGKARRQNLVGGLAELETMHGMADSIASGVFYAGDPAFTATYLRRLANIDRSDILDAARRYLVPERLSVAILSPAVSNRAPTEASASTGGVACVLKTIPNGMRVIVREDHRLPFVYVCLAARGGLLSETEELNGITRLATDLLTRGTARLSAADIAIAVESMGASISAFGGQNSMGVRGKCMREDLPAVMALMAECVSQPAFAQDEISRQRRLQLASIAEEREQPMYAARLGLNNLLFKGHPYRLMPNGTTGSVARVTRDDIVSFAARHLTADNMVLSCFGDVTADDAVRMAESAFASVSRARFVAPDVTQAAPVLPSRVESAEPREQAIVLAGFPGIRIGDPAEDALTVLATALSGLSSTLADEIREKRGLAYYCGAYQYAGLNPGAFVLYAGTRADAVKEVTGLMEKEVERVVTKGLTKEEFDRARNLILADYDMDRQDNGELAMTCALQEVYGMGYSHALEAPKRIEALTMEDVRKAAASVLNTNRLAVSIVIPAAKQQR
jgi:zinc protease